jgi:hypothetical protein
VLDSAIAKSLGQTQPTQQQPPSDYLIKTEDFIHGAAQGAGSEIAGMVAGIPSAIANSIPAVKVAEDIWDIPSEYRDYEAARARGKSPAEAAGIAAQTVQKRNDAISALKDRVKEFSTNPSRATGRAVADLIPVIVGGSLGSEVAAPAEAASAEAPAAISETEVPTATDFNSASKPSVFKQVIQGGKVAQPVAQQAVRRGVQAATENAGTADESLAANIENQPLLNRNQTLVDEHLSALRGLEQDAYDRMDEAAGFDVKAEKAQLANDQYKLKQLGNTDADAAMKDKLTASIEDSQARIADAEAKMRDAGVDPTEADAIHKQRMAGADFRKALIQNTSSDGQTVNVDGLLNASKKLQFTKYGDRLQQFFGSKEAADDFMTNLEQAQKLGNKAVKARQIAKWAVPALGIGGGTLIHMLE